MGPLVALGFLVALGCLIYAVWKYDGGPSVGLHGFSTINPYAIPTTTWTPPPQTHHPPPALPKRQRPVGSNTTGLIVGAAAKLAIAREVAMVVYALDDSWCFAPKPGTDPLANESSGHYVRVTKDQREKGGYIVECLQADTYLEHRSTDGPVVVEVFFVSAKEAVLVGVSGVGFTISSDMQRVIPLPDEAVDRLPLPRKTAIEERGRLYSLLAAARILHDLDV